MDSESVAERLRALPQYHRISPEEAQRWVNAVASQQPERLLWCIDRLSSLGGSDMGALLLEAQGLTPPFQSGADIINDRLMRSTPTAPLYHMKKGSRLEDVVIEATLKLYGGEFDFQTANAFQNNQSNLPFGLNGNIDFPWITKKNTRVLADVKCPLAGVVDETNKDPRKTFTHAVQLNTYQILCEAKGVAPFEKLINIHLELPPVLTDVYYKRLASGDPAEKSRIVDEMCEMLKYNAEGLRLNFEEHDNNPSIEINQQLRPMHDVIREVAAMNWQSVLDGHAPEPHMTSESELTPQALQRLGSLESELLNLEQLSRSSNTRINSVRNEIRELTQNATAKSNISVSGNFNITKHISVNDSQVERQSQRYGVDLDDLRGEAKSKPNLSDYDLPRMIQKLEEHGESIKEFIAPPPFDLNKVSRCFVDKGVNPDSVLSSKIHVGLSTKKAVQAVLAEQETSISSILDEAMSAAHNITAVQSSDSTKTISSSSKITR